VHGVGFRRHVALGIDVPMEDLPRRHAIEYLDAADLDQPVARNGSRPVVPVSRTISRINDSRW